LLLSSLLHCFILHPMLYSFPTRRSSDLCSHSLGDYYGGEYGDWPDHPASGAELVCDVRSHRHALVSSDPRGDAVADDFAGLLGGSHLCTKCLYGLTKVAGYVNTHQFCRMLE